MRLIKTDKKSLLDYAPFDVEKIIITHEIVEGWKKPPFQRPVAIGRNLGKLAVNLQDDEFLLTTIYLGVLDGVTYIVDGQHRKEAFIASGLRRLVAPVTTRYYPDGTAGLTRMCEDFLKINTHVKNPTANDKLRALEPTNPLIGKIREDCPFVGYSGFRRSDSSPIVSMAQAIRALVISAQEAPGSAGRSAVDHAVEMRSSEVNGLKTFLKLAYESWGRDAENKYLWSPMNLTMCLWFFRRMLRSPSSSGSLGNTTQAQFLDIFFGLMSNRRYRALLQGNKGGRLHDSNTRNPVCRELMKTIKAQLKKDGTKSPYIPKPSWPGI